MLPIYITDPNSKSNNLMTNHFTPYNRTGVISYGGTSRITNKKPDLQYVYYIYAWNPIFHKLTGLVSDTMDGKLDLPPEVHNDVMEERCRIVLDHSMEGFSVDNFNLELFGNYLHQYRPHTTFLTGDYKISLSEFVNTEYANYWERRVSARLNLYEIEQYIDQKLSPRVTKFKSICKNRLLRYHRILIIKKINELLLQDKINYSFGIVTEHGPDNELNFKWKAYFNTVNWAAKNWNLDFDELMAWVSRHGEKNLYHETVNLNINHADTVNQDLLNAHLDSYFEIVVETNYLESSLFLSEKTFKAIAWMQPFIICGNKGSVAALREFGYDVFDDIINHDYDLIDNHQHRLDATFSEIDRLCNISDDDWLSILNTIKPRLKSNFDNLMNATTRFNNW